MSGICGYWGRGEPSWLDDMLRAIAYRGDSQVAAHGDGFGLGLRYWRGRPGKAQAIHAAPDGTHSVAAGSLAPAAADPTAAIDAEGGDQFFGSWTSKPMVAAAVYAGLFEDEAPEAQYLRSYHRFYGLEDALYTPEFRSRSPPG